MLTDFYKERNFPEKERIRLEKNILFIVPNKDYDLKPVLKRLGLSKWEVAVTWPKEGLDILEEVTAANAKLVLQIDCQVSDAFWYVPGDCEQIEEVVAAVGDTIADTYVGLHHHDEYSIKDALGTVDQLIKMLIAQRQSFCCVTNHGSVGGWIKQYNACKKNGVKAIFGMETYVSTYRGNDPEEKKKHRSANHLVLIAKTMEGFDNIIKIHNDAQINGFYYTPRANHEAFKQWGKGIIASTACLAGEFPQLLMLGEKDKAKALYELYKSCFDEVYVEIQIIEYEAQREANRKLIEFAREVGAPITISCDSHYLEPEHADTHDVLMCIRQHKTLFDDKGEENDDLWNFDVKNLYYRTAEQMHQVFEKGFVDKEGKQYAPFKDDVFTEEVFQEAVANTRKIALSIEDIKLDSAIQLPKLYNDSDKTLRKKVNAGFKHRMLDRKPNFQEYIDRLTFEYDVIIKLGWGDYFLVMEKIISDTVEKFGEWAIGYGRGSAAGSLVSYCLGLTDVDPLQYGLLFERFLDASRPTPPDIDTDFDPRIREWVKEHIVETFGEDHVCSIGTYQTYRTKVVILDVARALNEDLSVANEITKKIDPLDSFDDEEGEEKKVDKLTFDELCTHYPELKAYFEQFPVVRHHAEILRNQVKNMGTHAGGVIISDINLKGRIPVLYDKASSENRKVISAWAEAGGNEELSAVGIVKYDILGLNNLPVVSDCIQFIKLNKGIEIKRWEIPIDDAKTIRMASKKDLVGIFQLDNPSTKPVADAVEMESLEDVAAVTSLIRPGPRDMGMDITYAQRKHGEPYAMPTIMRNILAETYGVITYQEQCMKVAQVLAGFTPTESYKFLKAIAKKQKELMDSFKQKFKDGAHKKVEAGELTDEDVENVWNLLEKFAGYGFNKSHAITYSALSTAELWLKQNYPTEYITSLINNSKQGKKKHGEDIFVGYVNYARRCGIEVLPPDISMSLTQFAIWDGKILFSLEHVKNVASMAEVIARFQPFTNIEDFHNRVKVEGVSAKGKATSRRPNKGVVESLIEAGAFDKFGPGGSVDANRNAIMAEYYRVRASKKETPPQHNEDEWVALEKEDLGLCLSQPPLFRQYEGLIRQKGWKLICELEDRKRVHVFGMVESITPRTSKTGNPMYMVEITDGLDKLTFFVFKGAQQLFKDHFKIGTIAAIPLSKFDDGDMRFYDDKKEFEIVKK